MALPRLSITVLCGLLFTATLLHPPFAAARSALVRDIFGDNQRYAAATAVSNITRQTAPAVTATLRAITGDLTVTAQSTRPGSKPPPAIVARLVGSPWPHRLRFHAFELVR